MTLRSYLFAAAAVLVLCAGFLWGSPVLAQSLTLDLGEPGGSTTARLIQLVLTVTLLSLAPGILVMVTSFTRIVIVLSLLRHAMGTQTSPPNQIIVGLSLFLTFFIMSPTLEKGAHFHAAVDDLLANADVLSIHCPATDETRGLLNAERIARMPDGAIVVNTSRGAVIGDEALIAALKSGKIAAAGLDVFNGEPANIHPGYRELDNVFLLPHIGSATKDTRDGMGFRALDNLDAIFAGKEPKDRVA